MRLAYFFFTSSAAKVGNVFTVLRQQDGNVHQVINHPDYRDEAFPIEEVGQCIAWEVKSTRPYFSTRRT